MTTEQDTISRAIDEFEAWMQEQGQPQTTLVDGCEVVVATEPEPAEARTVRVGDFFYSSWGYDQTNVDFYEVVGITPSGKSVRVQAVRQEVISDNGPSVSVAPVAGSVWGTDGVQLKRLRDTYTGQPSFYVASYADAYLWDGAPKHQTGANWGH